MKLPPEHFRAQAEHAQPTRFGEKLMQQMGWEKGQGLGREGQGRKEHIRVKRKDDNEGIGSGGGWNWGVKWWEQVFDEQATALLQKAAQTAIVPAAPTQPAPGSSSIDTGAVPVASVPSPQPAAAGSKQAAVLAQAVSSDRKKRKGSRSARTGKADSKPQRQKPAAGTGADGSATAPPAGQELSSGSASQLQGMPAIFGRQWSALEPGMPPAAASRDSNAVQSFKNTPKENWWGAKQFMSAGQLNGLQHKQPQAEKRQEFSEQDQTALYNQLHDGKSSGRGGLGKHSAPEPGVVRKSKFEGTRLVFDNDVADDVTVDEGQEEQPLDGQTGVPRIKYKKLATSILQQAPKRKMKCSKLEKLVHALIAESHGVAVAQQCQQHAILRVQVSKSRQFEVMDGVVSLVEAI